MRRSLIILLGVVMLMALLPTAGLAKKPIPDVKVLIPRAIDLVTEAYPGALWLQANGLPAEGELATSAEAIVEWQFFFSTPETPGPINIIHRAEIQFGPPPDGFGPVKGLPGFFTGAIAMPKAPSMTLKHAVKLLQRAGHTGAFDGVVLMHPLIAEPVNPRYLFQFTGPLGGKHHIAVDCLTKAVIRID
jgi:hypothetical protein